MHLKHDKLSDENWQHILSLGPHEGIRTAAQYLAEVQLGLDRARQLLHHRPEYAWNVEGVLAVHRQILVTVYPPESRIAGEFTREQMVLGGPGKEEVKGALPHRVRPDVENLCKVLRDSFTHFSSKADRIRVAIEFHVNFKALQAFSDANGRTSSVLLEKHLSVALKQVIQLEVNNAAYRSEMWTAIKEGKLGPIENTLNNAIQECLARKAQQNSKSVSDADDFGMPNEDVRLNKDKIFQLSDGAIKNLLFDPQVTRINGLTRRSLQEEFNDRTGDERAGIEDVKKLLVGAIEQEKRHEDLTGLGTEQAPTLNTKVLKRGN